MMGVAAMWGWCLAMLVSTCCVAYGQTVPTSPEADAALESGVQALRANDAPKAVQAFTVVTQLRPRFAEGFLNLGIAQEQEGDLKAATASLTKARELKPTMRGVNLFLGIAEYQANKPDKAEIDLLKEVKFSPRDAKALMWLGVSQMAQGHAERAAATLDAAASIQPEDPDILYHRGRAHLLVSKASYQKMFQSEPDSYRVHEVLGQADAEADRTVDAIGEYKLAIERAPRQIGLHEELADLYWFIGKMDLAEDLYQQELALDRYSVTTYYKLGSLRVTAGKAQDAMAPLQQALALDPTFESTYYYLGRAQVELGQEQAGIESLRHASVAKGDEDLNAMALYQLSRAYRRVHRTAEADAALAEFRRIRDSLDTSQKTRRAEKIARRGELPRPEDIPRDAEVAKP